MSSLDEFVDFLYTGLEGWIANPSKASDGEWTNSYYSWPSQRQELLDHIRTVGRESDVYLTPAVFTKKAAKRENFKATNVVWCEFDGKETLDYRDLPAPSVMVQTSSATHVHAYWKVPEQNNFRTVDEINRRITYYLEADSSGWDCTQLLRPPETQNVKRGGLDVVLSHMEDTHFPVAAFDRAPVIPVETVEITEASLGDVTQILKSLNLPDNMLLDINEAVPKVTARSSFLYKVALDLAELGVNHMAISTILFHMDERIGKWRDREDRLVRISELASIAKHSVAVQEKPTLYSLADILEHTDELTWVWGKWLHSQGLLMIASAPNVGKTQLGLQLSAELSYEGNCLGQEVHPVEKILFMSLEMDIRELKYVIKTQMAADDFRSEEWLRTTQFIDTTASLTDYENIMGDQNPNLIIIDSFLEIAEGDLKDGAAAKQMTRWLRRLRRKYDCAIILIHHMRKPSGSNKKPKTLADLYGDVTIGKDVDTALVMWVEEEDLPNEIDLIAVKARFTHKEEVRIVRSKNLSFDLWSAKDSTEPAADGDPKGSSKNLEF